MQIILQEDEILEALESYVRDQITIASNQEIKIDLKAGRGENGFSATLDIRKAQTALPSVTTLMDTGPASVCVPVTRVTAPVRTETVAEPASAISTGEERVELAAEAPVAEVQPETQDDAPVAEPVFAPKAGSLFAFNKKKAAE